jgi:hypothetical protein
MNSFTELIQAHPTISALLAYYIASAFVGSLPAPDVSSSMFYRFVFKFMNTLAANLTRAYSSKLPLAIAQAAGVAQEQERQGHLPDPPKL